MNEMEALASVHEGHGAPLHHVHGLGDPGVDHTLSAYAETAEASEHTTPPGLHRDVLGLPPTPPTLTNSDVSAPRKESLASNQEFAEAVRNALRAQASGTITPTGTHQSPQTPDPSPPSNRNAVKAAMAHVTPAQDLDRPKWPRSAYPSSRADSFHTARENVDSSQASMSRDLSPLSENLGGAEWLRRTGSMALSQNEPSSEAPRQNGMKDVQAEDNSELASNGTITPQSLYDRSGFSSLAGLEFSDDNLEAQLRRLKLVSDSPLIRRSHTLPAPALPRIQPPTLRKSVVVTTITDEESAEPSIESIVIHLAEPATQIDLLPTLNANQREPDEPIEQVEEAEPVSPANGFFADMTPPTRHVPDTSPAVAVAEKPRSVDDEPAHIRDPSTVDHKAADANNLVYREIREENVKRLSAIHEGGALRVGIILPKPGPERTLKRTVKYDALRGSEDGTIDTRRHSAGSTYKLRHKKAVPGQLLESLPIVAPSTSHKQKPEKAGLGNHGGRSVSMPVATLQPHQSPALPKAHLEIAVESPPTSFRTLRAAHTRGVSSDVHTSNGSHHRMSSGGSGRTKDTSVSPLRSEPKLRRFSRESQLENNSHVRRTSLASRTSDVSARKSLDARWLQPATTPLSISQFSDRTDVELCEAHGVTIFPHHNESVLVLNYGALSRSRENVSAPSDDLHFPVPLPPRAVGVRVRPASSIQSSDPNKNQEKHSPLTNPRAAPAPPAFRVIPPTPSELERQLGYENTEAAHSTRPQMPQRSLSLTQRARRYSESHILPFFTRNPSQRRRTRTMSNGNPDRPSHLSPFWRPRYFWEEYDSSDEDFDEDATDDILPRGGDTSNVHEPKKFLPRNMSVRMPGFRGTGGFLMGNSLGLERHGTNNRRHYVPREISAEKLGHRRQRRRVSIPLSLLTHHSIHPLRFRRQLSKFRAHRAERARERRRDVLRGQIQHSRPSH